MGVLLTPIILRKELKLDNLRGRSFAVDGYIVLHEFLAMIRDRTGTPLRDKDGNVTSHLVGLAFRTTKLISDYGMHLVFVFDGKPPSLKMKELDMRREVRRKAEREYRDAVERGDLPAAFSKAVMTGGLTRALVDDAKHLLDLLGIPWVQAPSEGEAQAAYMAVQGHVWASNSKDYDSLLFGAPRVVRFLSISGREWLPSKGRAKKVYPELIELDKFLGHLEINREQLIDLGILVGTDFNDGVKGVGPKTALKLVRKHGRIEDMPQDIREKLPDTVDRIRDLYLNPDVTDDYSVEPGVLQEDDLDAFLVGERNFSTKRVQTIINRMKNRAAQKSLKEFFGDSR
ncbi:flap endonuclease-1 [Candidatus Bathyarchaeota archaeon]|nr:flap endonuclease-1 [Candidatus Bathyarchaeota archaeon]MBT5642170.1 flap endonuclease-1 [Candidatus Bathyarchaeota archaeon]